MMRAYSVPNSRWAFKLAPPQLLGRAQKAYAAMESGEATDYALWKVVILRRYDINCDTYHQRFRNTTKTPEETYQELATRTPDLARKWAKESATREELLELVATEQVLNTLPEDVRIWVRERTPMTTAAAGQLAEDYRQARGL